jgi:RNA polymerase sigma factor (sigma-70 family)
MTALLERPELMAPSVSPLVGSQCAAYSEYAVGGQVTAMATQEAGNLIGAESDNQAQDDLGMQDELDVAFRAGSPDALHRAYEQYGALVYTFCSRRIGAVPAEDVTQEIFIEAWRRRENFDPDRGSLGAWLMVMARSRTIDALRSSTRIDNLSDRVGATLRPDSSVSASSEDTTADRMLLAHALSQLTERQRIVVTRCYFEQMTHVELSEELGLPLGTVKSDVRRGLARLAHLMGGLNAN